MQALVITVREEQYHSSLDIRLHATSNPFVYLGVPSHHSFPSRLEHTATSYPNLGPGSLAYIQFDFDSRVRFRRRPARLGLHMRGYHLSIMGKPKENRNACRELAWLDNRQSRASAGEASTKSGHYYHRVLYSRGSSSKVSPSVSSFLLSRKA